MSLATALRTLGLSRRANEDEIHRAYRELCLRWHPDRNLNDPDKAHAMMVGINAAREVIRASACKHLPEMPKAYEGPETRGEFDLKPRIWTDETEEEDLLSFKFEDPGEAIIQGVRKKEFADFNGPAYKGMRDLQQLRQQLADLSDELINVHFPRPPYQPSRFKQA